MAPQNEPRFSFPGFQFIGSQDSSEGTHEEMSGTISLGKKTFDVKLVRSKKVGERGSFLPASIEIAGKKWVFSDERFEGIAMLAMADKTPVIAFIPRGMKKIERILLLEDISSLSRVEVAGNAVFVGKQRPVLEAMRLKRLAGQYLKIGVIDSEDEKKAFRAWLSQQAEISKVQREEQEKAKKEERENLAKEAETEREKRKTENLKRVLAIRARSRVMAFTGEFDSVTGDPVVKWGIPVSADEYSSLNDGTFAILVKNGKAIEGFWVSKTKGGKISCRGIISISFDPPKKTCAVSIPRISAEKTILVDRGNGPEQALVFKYPEGIKDAARKGLNSGALVAVEIGGKFEVSSISAKRVSHIGTFNAI